MNYENTEEASDERFDVPYVQNPNGSTTYPTDQPATPAPNGNPFAPSIRDVYEASESWELGRWTRSSLVTSRAALKDMLSMIEGEMGRRKLMGQQR